MRWFRPLISFSCGLFFRLAIIGLSVYFGETYGMEVIENDDRGLRGPDDDRPDRDCLRPTIARASDNPGGGPVIHHTARPQLSD